MGKYKVVKKLGQGSYGTVYLVQDTKDGQNFVMKKITVSGMSEQELADCKKEIQILSVMKHKYIIRYKRSFVRKGALCIVMEYADGGDLHQLIRQQRHAGKHFSEDQILDWFTQACLGLKDVHSRKILHRDLKTQNIFLTSSGEVRLGDFGISRVLKNTMDQAHTLVGTPYYLSPEMVNGQPYDHRSDIWSMGVVLYEMLTLQHPFNADSLQMLALKIIQGNYPPIPKQYSAEVNDLLSKMLMQDAKKRLDIDGVLKTPIVYKWVKKYAPDCNIVREVEGLPLNDTNVELKVNDINEDDDDDLDVPSSKSSTNDLESKREIARKAMNAASAASSPVRPRLSVGIANKDVPEFQKNKLPPVPAKGAFTKAKSNENKDDLSGENRPRRGSVSVNHELDDEEPDWEIEDKDTPGSSSKAKQGPSSPFQEPSVARNTQVEILRAYLEERLGPARLNRIMETLQGDQDDQTKEKAVENLIVGHNALLPIVHTLLYLSKF